MPTQFLTPSGSVPENLFIELFSDTFGAEKAAFLYPQYHFTDIYQNDRYADFFLENGGKHIAIEIDDEASHNPSVVSQGKFYDDLLKQNSMIYNGWDVCRWAVRQMQVQQKMVTNGGLSCMINVSYIGSLRIIHDHIQVFIGERAISCKKERSLPPSYYVCWGSWHCCLVYSEKPPVQIHFH